VKKVCPDVVQDVYSFLSTTRNELTGPSTTNACRPSLARGRVRKLGLRERQRRRWLGRFRPTAHGSFRPVPSARICWRRMETGSLLSIRTSVATKQHLLSSYSVLLAFPRQSLVALQGLSLVSFFSGTVIQRRKGAQRCAFSIRP